MAKILVIEDDKVLSQALQNKLIQSGFSVDAAFNGQEGLDKTVAEHPDLILLDIVMPVMDGLTMLEKMQADGDMKNIPVIILTNLSGTDSILKARSIGEYIYLIKTDWKLEDVVQKIRETLGPQIS